MTFHPWRYLRDRPAITFGFADLQGADACNFPDLDVVLLHEKLKTIPRGQARRRSSLAHEIGHRELGHTHCEDRRGASRQCRDAEAYGARLLITLENLIEVLRWTTDRDEAADELWVDRLMLDARLTRLHPAERGSLQQAIRTKGEVA